MRPNGVPDACWASSPSHPPRTSTSIFSAGSQNTPRLQTGSTSLLSAHLELTHRSPVPGGELEAAHGCLISPPPLRARAARGSPERVIRKRMQMLQLENPAQETPSPTSPGPQPPSASLSLPSAPHLWLSTPSLALTAGRAAQQGSYQTLGMKTPTAREKNQAHTWRTGCPHHTRTKPKSFCPGFGCFSYNNRANSLCARLTVSGPGRTLALLSRQAQVCTTALPKWETALKTRNPSPIPAAEQLSCFPSGTWVHPSEVVLRVRVKVPTAMPENSACPQSLL